MIYYNCLIKENMLYRHTTKSLSMSRVDLTNITAPNSKTYRDSIHLLGGMGLFNQPIGGWDMGSIGSTKGLFHLCETFNQPIGDWNMSEVTNISWMFSHAYSFNQPLGDWDTSSVKYMSFTFYLTHVFNQPIMHWNISGVKSTAAMFCKAVKFNQDLSLWKLPESTNCTDMFDDCPIEKKFKPKGVT